MESTYTAQRRSDAYLLYAAVQRNPSDKQTIIKVMANTYINGMKDQARLSAQPPGPVGATHGQSQDNA